jgi:hypothetical protein
MPGLTPNPRDRTNEQPGDDGTSTITSTVNTKERGHSAGDPPLEDPPRPATPDIPDLGTGTAGNPEPVAPQ